MKELFVSYELALKLKEKGFNEECFGFYWKKSHIFVYEISDKRTNDSNYFGAPLYQQAVNWFDSKGIHIDITPEFYKDGINWNFQVWEYDPNGYKCTSDRSSGMYGDNHEYPTRKDAIIGGIQKALKYI